MPCLPGTGALWLRPSQRETAAVAFASVLVFTFRNGLADGLRWLLGRDCRPAPLPRPCRRLKVAVLGGGLGGAATALWLRDAFGSEEDLEVVVICDDVVGGRCRTIEFDGGRYEAGTSVVSNTSVYFRQLMRRFFLRELHVPGLHLPFGIFDGTQFLLCGNGAVGLGGSHLATKLFTICWFALRFGALAIWRMRSLEAGPVVPDFPRLYRALQEGATFAHPRELLSILGHRSLRLSERSIEHWLLREHRLPAKLVTDVVAPCLRSVHGGQDIHEVHAFAGLAGLLACGNGLYGQCFAVHGGIDQVPRLALEASKARVIHGSARFVRRATHAKAYEPGFEVAYVAEMPPADMMINPSARRTASACGTGSDGLLVEAFHVCVVAFPLERSALRFEGLTVTDGIDHTAPSATEVGLPSLRHCAAHFVRSTLDLKRFCKTEPHGRRSVVPASAPAHLWTTVGSAVPFYSVSLQIPVDLSSSKLARVIAEGAERGEPQVYKVLAPRRLSDDELAEFLPPCGGTPVHVVDWRTYPSYSEHQSFRSLVLDCDGVYYINAVDQVMSSVEWTLIGARNAVNSVLEWVEQRRGPQGF